MNLQHTADTKRQPRYGLVSCGMFLLSAMALVTISTLFDSSLGQLPLPVQRWIGFGTLVLPALVGVVLGGLGLRQSKKALAILGIVINMLFALYFSLVLSFAG